MSERHDRQAYLDWIRGIAVLIMIEAHTMDSWTRLADQRTRDFGYAMILGGFGAPLFLFLAGVGAVLSAGSKVRRTGLADQASWAVQRRGWQIFGLAFLFRLQSFVLSSWSSPLSMLKVDILNIMGPAIIATAMVWLVARTRSWRVLAFAGCAAAIAMLTPIVRTTTLIGWLPDPVEWYVRPVPGRTTFTLFPWAGFVFAGAAVGTLIDSTREPRAARRVVGLLAVTGGLLIAAGYWTSLLPSIYAESHFWTSSPTFFFLRVGIITALLPLAYLWEKRPWREKILRWSPIEELGRSSLFVYWIHVEIVYGFLTMPLRRRLSFGWAVVAWAVFTMLMLALVLLKNRIVSRWKARPVGQFETGSGQAALTSHPEGLRRLQQALSLCINGTCKAVFAVGSRIEVAACPAGLFEQGQIPKVSVSNC